MSCWFLKILKYISYYHQNSLHHYRSECRFIGHFFDALLLWDTQSNLSNKTRHPIRTSSSTALFMACCESLPKNKFYYLSHFKTLTGAIKDNRNRLDRTMRPGIMSTAGMIEVWLLYRSFRTARVATVVTSVNCLNIRSCIARVKTLGREDICYAVMRIVNYVSQGALPFQFRNGSVLRALANEVKGLRLSTLKLKGLPN